jgi:hypothetical protein
MISKSKNKINVINLEIKETKKAIEIAIKNKKKVSHLRAKLSDLRELRKEFLAKPMTSETPEQNMAALTNDKVLEFVTKIIPTDFDGNASLLPTFIKKLKALKANVPHTDNKTQLLSLVILKLTSSAEEAVPDNPNSIDEIITILQTTCKGRGHDQVMSSLDNMTYNNKDTYRWLQSTKT